MEADIAKSVVETVNASEEDVRVATVVGDDDSTAISALRQSVDPSIAKHSDANHAKKILGNKLYELRPNHPELTEMVIKAIQKDFAYAMQQCKDNPTRLASAFKAIPGKQKY